MGFLAAVTAFARTVVTGERVPEVTLDRDGDETATAGHFAPPGVDAVPLPGDVAYAGDDVGAGAAQAVAYQDPTTPPVAAGGEVRLYSRSGPGVVAVELWLKADGTIVAANGLGSMALGPDGRVIVTTPLGTFSADGHGHNSPFGPIGPPIPGT